MSGKGRPYWLLLDDQPQGAFSWDQLLKMLQEDRIKSETLFSFCRAPEWKPLSYLLPPESLAERQTRNLVRKFIRECDHGPDRLVEEKEDPWFGYTSYTLTERQLSEFLDMAAVDNAASSDRLVLPSLKYSGDFDACMERISALNPERYRYFKTSFHGTKIWEVRGEYEGVPEREALGSAEKADEGDASVDSKKPKRAKPDSFFLLQDGEVQGPFTKDELEVRFYAGQIGSDVPYAYDRARRWRPLSHMFRERKSGTSFQRMGKPLAHTPTLTC
jgi:hypothetical protein